MTKLDIQYLVNNDELSLAVVEHLKGRLQEAASNVGSVGNVFTIFLHDLVIHFTGILIHRSANAHYPDSIQFPKVNKSYALSPELLNDSDLLPPRPIRTVKTTLKEIPLSGMAIGEALPFGYGQSRVTSKIINLLGSFKPFVSAYLPNKENQIAWALETINELCRLHEISHSKAVLNNWKRYMEAHTTSRQDSIERKGIVLGTRNSLQNRKLAINYMQQGKEVVGITHGEVANSVIDEPPFGYSERSLCTTLIDYGDFDEDGEFNKPLIFPKKIFYRSSSGIEKRYQRDDRITNVGVTQLKTLYIPTTYSGNDLYGPFHIYEDVIYQTWQKALFSAFPGLTMKIHPKSKSPPPVGIPTEKKILEDCIADYGLLVFDYFATGAVLALMSDRPVIYFDIGLRRLSPSFLSDMKDRSEYVKIDLTEDLEGQIGQAIRRFETEDREWSNADMARYSICREDKFRWMDLVAALSAGTIPKW